MSILAGDSVRALADSIREHLADGRRGEILRSGVQVAILGPPNAGKSSLLNVLARRPAAIVSSIAGTTRDVVQVPLNIAGYPVIVSDTAGLRETEDFIEKEGVLRAQQCASDADICVVMMDIQNAVLLHTHEYQGYIQSGAIVVLNKRDQLEEAAVADVLSTFEASQRDQMLVISCALGDGIDVFVDKLAATVKQTYAALASALVVDAFLLRGVAESLTGALLWLCSTARRRTFALANHADAKRGDAMRTLTFLPLANTLRGHSGAVLTIAFAPELGKEGLLFTGSADRSIKVWDPWGGAETPLPTRSSYSCVQTLTEHSGSVVCVQVMTQQKHGLVSCSLDHTVKTWYPAEGRALLLYPWFLPAQSIAQPGTNWPSTLCVRSGASDTLFVGDSGGCISVYTSSATSMDSDAVLDLQHDEPLGGQSDNRFQFRLKRKYSHFHSLGISRLQLVADNCFVVSLGFDEKAQVIDAISGVLSSTISNASGARFTSCSWDSPSQLLLLGDSTGFVQVWDIFEDKLVGKKKMVASPPLAIAGIYVLTGAAAGDFLLTGLANGMKQWLINRDVGYRNCSGHSDAIVAVAVINDDSTGSCEDADDPCGQEEGDERLVEAVGLTKTCQFFSASLDGSIRCWDSFDMKVSFGYEERQSEITCMIASKKFRKLFTGHDGGFVKVWGIHTGEFVEAPSNQKSSVTCLAWQEILLAGNVSGCVSMWEVNYEGLCRSTPFQLTLVNDKSDEVTCLAFSKGDFLAPDGQEFFVAGYFTGQIAIWSFAKRAVVRVFKAHDDAVCSLALHGCFLFSGSDDTLLRMWNVFHLTETYELGVLRPPSSASSSGSGSPIVCLDVMPLRGLVCSAASDGTLLVWDYKAFEDHNAFDAYGKIVFRAKYVPSPLEAWWCVVDKGR
ncbi:hypothetical protein BBJ28_00003143 [Nothophytophthora sp. Chile5]|nr:hypothetical protein BBJ28_00003143 [Nothophytophthora sp. Chile5]